MPYGPSKIHVQAPAKLTAASKPTLSYTKPLFSSRRRTSYQTTALPSAVPKGALVLELPNERVDYLTIQGADIQAGVRPSTGGNDAMLGTAASAIQQAEDALEKVQQP
jgi:hypothetical protein